MEAIETAAQTVAPSRAVLVVDLDGTLIRTDLLHEALFSAAKAAPGKLALALTKLIRGRAAFKRALAEAVPLHVQHLPFREEVLELVAARRADGDKIVLATASDESWARQIASELGLFDEVLASDGVRNLKGPSKLAAIEDYCRRQGVAAFDYIGDSRADLPIWRAARRAYMAGPSPALESQVHQFAESAAILDRRPRPFGAVLQALRPIQWTKNLLVFVPLITSHQVLNAPLAAKATIAAACFSACASAVYVVNDLFDIEADRDHPIKRHRPFASAALPISWGPPLALLMALAGLLVSLACLPAIFTAALAVYVAATLAYSLWLKRVVMLDVIVLAGLYTLRVLAGGLATGIAVSEWLMAFSLFMFVSLAFAKRYAELARLADNQETTAAGRGYVVADRSLIETMGPACGLLAVLVLALYIQSEQMHRLYANPWALWLLCPLLMYWVGRLWWKVKRGELAEDPVVFAIRDSVSLTVALLAFALVALAAWK